MGLREGGDGASANQGRTRIEVGDMPGSPFYGVQYSASVLQWGVYFTSVGRRLYFQRITRLEKGILGSLRVLTFLDLQRFAFAFKKWDRVHCSTSSVM